MKASSNLRPKASQRPKLRSTIPTWKHCLNSWVSSRSQRVSVTINVQKKDAAVSARRQNGPERRDQVCMRKSKTRLLQSFWHDALAAQQQRVRHFSQHQPQRKLRGREERRPVQRLRQRFRELRIL